MNEFDDSIELRSAAPHEWTGRADPRREATTGMFGGWTAAMLLKAVLSDAIDQGTPCSLCVHFLKPIAPGSELTIRTRSVGGGRSLSTWQSELATTGTEGPAAMATVVLGRRRESLGFTDPSMPQAPSPDSLPKFSPPGSFGQRSLIRPVYGLPPFNRPNARSVFWLRETSGRALDHVQLAYLADNFAPRSWSKRSEPGPYSTITMSTYFHATHKEVSDLGDDYVLMEVDSSRAESSTVGAHARIWSRGGALLVTTEQLGWFK